MPVDSTTLAERAEAGQVWEAAAVEAYSSFNVEAGIDFPDPWSYSWLGRIVVFNFGGHGLYIGPHWYCSVLMLGFILAVGLFQCNSVTSLEQLAGSVFVTVLSTVSFLRCALSNPGVLQKNHVPTVSESLSVRVRRCDICQIVQPRGCQHCQFCQVCVQGHDHHCPWMGKCIGSNNLCSFYTFLFCGFGSLAYILLVALAQPPPA
ncbi:ERF2 [Symbiodinium sp. CCMP2456]|nr:ERF2 [Symbiodinium sp. CCMP2456]